MHLPYFTKLRQLKDMEKIVKTEAEWKEQLSVESYKVTRKAGTERAFSGKFDSHYENGNYNCICCGSKLFSSEHKFNSGTGWPSFYQPSTKEAVAKKVDNSLFIKRTEIVCSKCDAHLGHSFPDGPEPTGIRYCINSVSLNFDEKK